ncbi:AAI [Musa troglodytarum]|uniref:AAI n=2 Tax=Musa troglodytarum TaxID=320322 RepID=A0A9E7I381_9LILI|nr:AAI [Musa troglodytarum]
MSNTRWVGVSLSVFFSLLHGPLFQGLAPAPPPALDCTDAMLNLSACLTYAEAGSNLTRPGKGCCRGLASVVDTEPVCLCQLIVDNDVFGVEIDTTKALTLPTACRVDAPPATLCAGRHAQYSRRSIHLLLPVSFTPCACHLQFLEFQLQVRLHQVELQKNQVRLKPSSSGTWTHLGLC